MTPNDEVLNSWKEVASYLGRGVRTVQRWEQELSLPVRRPRGKSRSAVIAFKTELDKWLHDAPAEQLKQEHVEEQALTFTRLKFTSAERHTRLHNSTQMLISKAHLLLSRSESLCEQLKNLQTQVERTMRLSATNINRNSKSYGVVIAPPPEKEAKPAESATQSTSKQHAIAS